MLPSALGAMSILYQPKDTALPMRSDTPLPQVLGCLMIDALWMVGAARARGIPALHSNLPSGFCLPSNHALPPKVGGPLPNQHQSPCLGRAANQNSFHCETASQRRPGPPPRIDAWASAWTDNELSIGPLPLLDDALLQPCSLPKQYHSSFERYRLHRVCTHTQAHRCVEPNR